MLKQEQVPERCRVCDKWDTCPISKTEYGTTEYYGILGTELIAHVLAETDAEELEEIGQRSAVVVTHLIEKDLMLTMNREFNPEDLAQFIGSVLALGYYMGKTGLANIDKDILIKSTDMPEYQEAQRRKKAKEN